MEDEDDGIYALFMNEALEKAQEAIARGFAPQEVFVCVSKDGRAVQSLAPLEERLPDELFEALHQAEKKWEAKQKQQGRKRKREVDRLLEEAGMPAPLPEYPSVSPLQATADALEAALASRQAGEGVATASSNSSLQNLASNVRIFAGDLITATSGEDGAGNGTSGQTSAGGRSGGQGADGQGHGHGGPAGQGQQVQQEDGILVESEDEDDDIEFVGSVPASQSAGAPVSPPASGYSKGVSGAGEDGEGEGHATSASKQEAGHRRRSSLSGLESFLRTGRLSTGGRPSLSSSSRQHGTPLPRVKEGLPDFVEDPQVAAAKKARREAREKIQREKEEGEAKIAAQARARAAAYAAAFTQAESSRPLSGMSSMGSQSQPHGGQGSAGRMSHGGTPGVYSPSPVVSPYGSAPSPVGPPSDGLLLLELLKSCPGLRYRVSQPCAPPSKEARYGGNFVLLLLPADGSNAACTPTCVHTFHPGLQLAVRLSHSFAMPVLVARIGQGQGHEPVVGHEEGRDASPSTHTITCSAAQLHALHAAGCIVCDVGADSASDAFAALAPLLPLATGYGQDMSTPMHHSSFPKAHVALLVERASGAEADLLALLKQRIAVEVGPGAGAGAGPGMGEQGQARHVGGMAAASGAAASATKPLLRCLVLNVAHPSVIVPPRTLQAAMANPSPSSTSAFSGASAVGGGGAGTVEGERAAQQQHVTGTMSAISKCSTEAGLDVLHFPSLPTLPSYHDTSLRVLEYAREKGGQGWGGGKEVAVQDGKEGLVKAVERLQESGLVLVPPASPASSLPSASSSPPPPPCTTGPLHTLRHLLLLLVDSSGSGTDACAGARAEPEAEVEAEQSGLKIEQQKESSVRHMMDMLVHEWVRFSLVRAIEEHAKAVAAWGVAGGGGAAGTAGSSSGHASGSGGAGEYGQDNAVDSVGPGSFDVLESAARLAATASSHVLTHPGLFAPSGWATPTPSASRHDLQGHGAQPTRVPDMASVTTGTTGVTSWDGLLAWLQAPHGHDATPALPPSTSTFSTPYATPALVSPLARVMQAGCVMGGWAALGAKEQAMASRLQAQGTEAGSGSTSTEALPLASCTGWFTPGIAQEATVGGIQAALYAICSLLAGGQVHAGTQEGADASEDEEAAAATAIGIGLPLLASRVGSVPAETAWALALGVVYGVLACGAQQRHIAGG